MKRSTVFAFGTIALAVVAAVAPMPPSLVERLFSAGLYPLVQPVLTRLSNLVPFALFDVLLVTVAILTLLWLKGVFVRFRTGLWRFLARMTTLVAVLYLAFLAVWGLNYRREPLRRTLGFDQTRVTRAALRRLADRAVAELNALHPGLPAHWPDWPELRPQLAAAFERAQRQVGPSWRVELGDPKRSLLNQYFKRTATDGMVNPFSLEVLVNRDVLPFERPFVAAHEWGHLAGRADESEASFVGWLACMHGPPAARYSAWISLYGAIAGGLPREERAAVGEALADGPRRDLRALAERIARQSTPFVRHASQAAYDRFLKANRLEAGVASYGLVVTLLLGASVDIPPLIVGEGERREGRDCGPATDGFRASEVRCRMFTRVSVVGRGRAGGAIAARLEERGLLADRNPDLVVLAVPDGAIANVAAGVAPGPWVAHLSGATHLSALAPHVLRFSVHPLQTFTRSRGPEQLDGAWAAIAAESPEAAARGRWLADTLGLRPFDLDDAARTAYHAGAVIASNYLVTLFRSASRLLEHAKAPPDALVPLMRRTIDNGFELTGPIARGDWATVDAHLAAIRTSAPDLEPMYRALAELTRRQAQSATA